MVSKQKQATKPKHRHTKNYLKVYWPYLPLIIIIILGFVVGLPSKKDGRGVLSYATNVSTNGLLDATNKQRLNNGQSSLKLNDKLDKAAQDKANDMVNKDYWSHNTPDGNAPWVFITNNGYLYEKVGENLAYGFNTSSDVVSGWMNSPSHKANLLDPDYVDVGFGFANSPNYQKSEPATIVVAMYGQPQNSVSSSTLKVEGSHASAQSSFNSQNTNENLKPKTVSRIQAITDGNMPWAQVFVGVLIGAGITMLLIKHGIRIKKVVFDGEQFVVHHPLLDITVIAFLALLIIMSQQAGIIL